MLVYQRVDDWSEIKNNEAALRQIFIWWMYGNIHGSEIDGLHQLVMTNIAMEAMALIEIDDVPFFPARNLHLFWGFSMAMLVRTKWFIIPILYPIDFYDSYPINIPYIYIYIYISG